MRSKFEFLQKMHPIATHVSPKLSPLEGIKVVLFDIYGTLLVSAAGDILATELHARSVVEALASVGITVQETPVAEAGSIIINTYMTAIFEEHDKKRGRDILHPEVNVVTVWKDVMSDLSESGLLSVPADLDYRKLALAFEFKTNPVWPMPGFKEVLQTLKDAGILLGIVSNSQFFTPIIVNYFLDDSQIIETEAIEGFVPDLCVYSYKEEMAKPSPALFDKARKSLEENHGIAPQEALYVGNDMLNDIYCAQKTGFKTALFAGDVRSLRLRKNHEEVQGIVPDITITALSQLLDIVNLER